MSPTTAMNDAPHGGLWNAKRGHYSEDALAACVKAGDFHHLCFGKGRVAVSLSECKQSTADCVLAVLATGDQFEIGEPVICLHTVDVIDLVTGRYRSYKSGHHEAMDETNLRRTRPIAEQRANVAGAAPSREKNALGNSLLMPAPRSDKARKASYPTRIGDFVHPFVSTNGKPSFCDILDFSHRRTSSRVPVVRSGVGGATPRRAAFIFAQIEVKA